jgi:hypothetical protein
MTSHSAVENPEGEAFGNRRWHPATLVPVTTSSRKPQESRLRWNESEA